MNKLDEAKINLKTVLNRLETLVEAKLQNFDQIQINNEVVEKISSLEKQIENLKVDLKEKEDEINYLREQSHELQAEIGIERERNFKLQQKNNEAAKKVDEIIGEVRTYLAIN